MCPQATEPTQHVPVYRAAQFRVTNGVNEGDPLADASELVHEDVYTLAEAARPVRLDLIADPANGGFRVSPDSGAGQPGAQVFLDCRLTFIRPTRGTRDALVFVEVETDGTIAEVYFHPLAPLTPANGYALVTIDRTGAMARLAGTATVGVTHGARIPAADTPRSQSRPRRRAAAH